MSVFRKIFGSISKSDKGQPEKKVDNKFLPKKDLPIDESFTVKFNENGGKFLYSENLNEAHQYLQQILKENNWTDKMALILNKKLKEKFKDFDWKTTSKVEDGHYLFTTCEYLIANDGSLLISSNQIAEKKLNELPKNFVVFATTSQIVQTIGEGLHGIKAKNKKNIPTNSTLNKKNSNIFGQFNFKPTNNISLGYNFSLTDDLNTFEYNSLITKMEFGNFITQFDYLEERGAVGSTNIIQNTTKYNFDNQNSISFNTRRNRKLDLTEYYDLVYEYKNDCLVAGIKYKKNYYNDADIKPVEELFFSITIVPLGTFSPDKMALK